MENIGVFNSAHGAEDFGLGKVERVFWNLVAPSLYEQSLLRREVQLVDGGAIVADTGIHTGRSPKDKFIARDNETEKNIWWDNNGSLAPADFETLLQDFIKHTEGMELFVQDLYGGADPRFQVRTRVYTEYAWHSLFIRNMLIRPEQSELAAFVPELTIIDLPSFKADPKRHGCRSETIIACDMSRKIILIGGTSYAGEIKKSVFSYLNYVLPPQSVMPMHCSANSGPMGDVAVFFGLSGTGKTTLSADPARTLLGDDEHGWSESGVFNFEGGCYAKTINLSREAEPEIFATTERFGTVLENVVIDPITRVPDFCNVSKTENARCAYPIDFIPNASLTGQAGTPTNIVMLTCDAFGVLPPIAMLSPAAAMYHFLSGYTAKVAGTEKGVTEPEATFSTCFGAPFIPRHPSVYGNMLRDFIARYNVRCWLVNTGWTGGKYGTGKRMPIKVTRALLTAALDGSLAKAEFHPDPYFGFAVPTEVPGIDSTILNPVLTWADRSEFDATAKRLVQMFRANFTTFESHVDDEVKAAAPKA